MGRQPGLEVFLEDPLISRRHAEIFETGAGYYLRDLSSTNGTFVNGTQLTDGDHLLRDGDVISLGGSKVSYVFYKPPEQTQQLTVVLSKVKPAAPETLSGVNHRCPGNNGAGP